MVAQTIKPPATGDMVRPKAPEMVAREPMSLIAQPNCAAWGVTAPLKASAAASPEPLRIAKKYGPKVAA